MTELPPSLAANPRLADWLNIRADGVVEVRSGKVELGQGVLTALAQIAAEELDVAVSRILMLPVLTGVSPDEGYTAGSQSIQNSGAALRVACAEARSLYLAAAAGRWGVSAGELTVRDGTIEAPGGTSVSYWALAGDGLLDRPATGSVPPRRKRTTGSSAPACPGSICRASSARTRATPTTWSSTACCTGGWCGPRRAARCCTTCPGWRYPACWR